MRWRTLPIELLLLAFLAVFLVYPLLYVLPGAASDEDYEIRLLSLGKTAEEQLRVSRLLEKLEIPSPSPPTVIETFPLARRTAADQFAEQLRQAGAGVEVVRTRNWTTFYFRQVFESPFLWDCFSNSLLIAAFSTLGTTLVCLPLAYWFTRYRFRGQAFLAMLLLVPLIVPPFVGAIGLARLLDRFGTLNLWLMNLGLVDPAHPIDWIGGSGLGGIVLMQILHLYPILYLNLSAAWANVDQTLEDAARNLGASEFRVFRTITFPLLLPGYFAGASLVFVWAFTDLGTPLVFNLTSVIPVQIYDQVSDPQRTNSIAYALVVITLALTAFLFYAARWLVSRQSYIGGGKGAIAVTLPHAGPRLTIVIYATVIVLTLLALLPDVGVVLLAVAKKWFFTPLPESYTTAHLAEVWRNRIASLSIRNSLYYSAWSTGLDICMGLTLAWLIARRPSWLTSVLDGLAMLPLALPGLVLAFGYLTCYSNWELGGWALNPTSNPAFLLIVAYTVRRLPYMTRSALAGLQQISPTLEEAAENLGATRWRILRTITVPLLAANIVAGAILTFAFAVLEVSDSLMLAREEKYFPITRAILGLLMRPDEGDMIASALALFAMGLLALSLIAASLALGRKLGEMFRA